MVINFMAPAFAHFVKSKTVPVVKINHPTKGQSKVFTQNGLNRLQDNCVDDWNMAASYGELLMPMAVCLVYSSGIPVLLYIAAFGFAFKYWVDKWCMLRAYEKPKQVDDGMFSQFGGFFGLLSVTLMGKVAVGSWLYASAGGRDPRQEYPTDVERPYVIPYMTTGAIVFVYWVLTTWFGFDCLDLFKGVMKKKKKKKKKPVELSDSPKDGDDSVESPPEVDDDENDVKILEDLPPFSVAYRDRKLVNADYDYEMDDVEREEKMEGAFGEAIKASVNGARLAHPLADCGSCYRRSSKPAPACSLIRFAACVMDAQVPRITGCRRRCTNS